MSLKSTIFISLFGLLALYASPVLASTYEGSLCTGVGCGMDGTVITVPTASPVAGTFSSTQSVTLTATGSSSIHYTTNGTDPTCTTGTTYSGAISVSSTTTIEAISCYPNSNASSVASFAYTISTGGGGGGGGGGGTPADTTAPIGTVSINAGAMTASTLSATLTLSATDSVGVTQMLISNDSGFAGATWETYSTSKSWTLVSGDGVKTVYVKFKDAAGNTSVTASDTITVSGTGVVEVPVIGPTEGCSGGNQYNTSTGALCVNNAGPQIPGCGNRTTGFSTASGTSCVGNRVATVAEPNAPGASGYNFGTKTLKNGSKGEAVKELQRFLNATLNLGLVVDGMLGPKTIKVIKQWQKDRGLVADGLIGAKTKAKMNAEAN